METGLRAAEKLHPSSTGVSGAPTSSSRRSELGRIGEAVRPVVPQQMWAAIVEQLEELEEHPEALDVGDGLLR